MLIELRTDLFEPAEIDEVDRVGVVLGELEPVARRNGLPLGHRSVPRHIKGVEDRKRRTLVRRTHIREDEPLVLVGWIGAVAETALDSRIWWLAGGIEHAAVDAVQPAVIATLQAIALDRAVLEGGAAMAAMELDQSNLALSIPEQHQVFPITRTAWGKSARSDESPTGCQ